MKLFVVLRSGLSLLRADTGHHHVHTGNRNTGHVLHRGFDVFLHMLAQSGDTRTVANLHVDADEIETAEDWARLYNEALWLERWRNRNRAELIAELFGEKRR